MQPIVLIVSDDIPKISILRHVLQPIAHLVERSDIDSANELLKGSAVDVVILDSHLSDPMVAAKQLRSSIGKFDTPLLLITSELKKSFTIAALAAGVTDFINEPLDKDEIEQRMAVALKASHRSQEISRLAQKSTPSRKTSAKELSNRDLYNKQALDAIASARKTATTLSILLIELDQPSKSEEAIDYLSSILEKNLRPNDLMIPQGKGKYLLILPKASHRAAEIIAETIRYEVAMRPLHSVSIGLVNTDETPVSDLIQAVSDSFLKAKASGNRIISA
jgi:two-component system cell cycle response regulator